MGYVLEIETHDVAFAIGQRESFIEEIIRDYLSAQNPDQVRLSITSITQGPWRGRPIWRITAPNEQRASEIREDLEQRIGITELNRIFRLSHSDQTSSLYSIGYIYREYREFYC
jgi:hypothetical protein